MATVICAPSTHFQPQPHPQRLATLRPVGPRRAPRAQLQHAHAHTLADFDAENARLRAELAALEPSARAAPTDADVAPRTPLGASAFMARSAMDDTSHRTPLERGASRTLHTLSARVAELLAERRELEARARELEVGHHAELADARAQLAAANARAAAAAERLADARAEHNERERVAAASAAAQLTATRAELTRALAALDGARDAATEAENARAAERARADELERLVLMARPSRVPTAPSTPKPADVREAHRRAADAEALVAHVKEMYVERAAEVERMRDALGDAHAQVRAARAALSLIHI